ncbi:hypothetical protein [Helicobacter pullorum]|uniref:hypothetical protein n=1 Tax=Helicobacter pullorum TaxID=35818 RepID=UPI00242E152A|nr:hypothetical protein [Helicobacter pullorum]
MTNKNLKDLRDAIHKDLKINPTGSCFSIKEDSKESAIKKIEFTFKNQDDVLVIRQRDNNHAINLLTKYSTNQSCDCIIFRNKQGTLKLYFCEIKSSYNEKYVKEACEQMQASKLFVAYLLACYRHYHNKKIDIRESQYYYIYPKIGNSNKKKPYIDNANQTHLQFKPLMIDERGIARISKKEMEKFFKDS